MKPLLLKLHRWVALIFALPLVFVLGTGLILSFEPWLMVQSIEPNSLTPTKIEQLLGQHDPGNQARTLVYRNYDNDWQWPRRGQSDRHIDKRSPVWTIPAGGNARDGAAYSRNAAL